MSYVFQYPDTLPPRLRPPALIIPAAYHSARVDTNPSDEYPVIPSTNATSDMVSSMQQVHDLDKAGQKGLLTISRGTALLLLATYVAYLVFQVRTDPFRSLRPIRIERIKANIFVGDVCAGLAAVWYGVM